MRRGPSLTRTIHTDLERWRREAVAASPVLRAMKIISDPVELQVKMASLRKSFHRIGFVPTMGYLHDGHLALMELARKRAEALVVSIFVNPKQFGPNEDLNAYPKHLEQDEALCREMGVDVLFCPKAEDMYTSSHSVEVTESYVSRSFEGAHRPGHFNGVLTVVTKLFNLVQPTFSVFGQKDAQQLFLIKKMVADLNYPIDIVAGPTIREEDGLAMSSRNSYLSEDERRDAVCLREALDRASDLVTAGSRDVEAVKEVMREVVRRYHHAELDYIELVDPETFLPVKVIETETLALIAARVGQPRLLDNGYLIPLK